MPLNTTRRRWPLALAGLWAGAASASVAPAEVREPWPQARLIGQARLRVFGLHVYDAWLWSPARPTPADWMSQPFGLVLTYARALRGADIARRSLDEMARQGVVDDAVAEAWRVRLQATFPDVQPGDRLSGLHRPGAPAQLLHNGVAVGAWSDAELVRRFFGIWLSPQTSEPALREALFGGRG